MGEQLLHGRRLGAGVVVLAIDQFLAVGRLHALVLELQTRQLDAGHHEQRGAEDRPAERGDHQRIGDRPDQRKSGHMGRQMRQQGQEGDQRHGRIDQRDA